MTRDRFDPIERFHANARRRFVGRAFVRVGARFDITPYYTLLRTGKYPCPLDQGRIY